MQTTLVGLLYDYYQLVVCGHLTTTQPVMWLLHHAALPCLKGEQLCIAAIAENKQHHQHLFLSLHTSIALRSQH